MNTAVGFPTAARIWYQRHTLHWFLLRFWFSGIAFVLDSPVCLPPFGVWEHYRRMLRFAPLADFLKVLLITTWSPSSALLADIRIIIPRRWSWRKTSYGLFHSYMRSLRTRTGTTGRLLETSPSFSGKTFPDLVCSAVPIRHGAYAVTLLSTGTYL